MAPCLLRLCALAALLRPCGAAEPAAPGQPAAGWPGLRRPGAPAAALAGVRRAAQAPTAGGWRPQTALPAAALGVQTLLRDDHADVQDMLLQPVPPSVEAPLSQLQGGLGGRGRLQSLAQRQPVRTPQSPPLVSRPLEPLTWTALPAAAPPRMPHGSIHEGLLAVDSKYCDPPCDEARGGVCAIKSRFAWSAGGSPACVCSDPAAGGDGCTLGAAAGKGGLLAQGLAKVGGVLGTVRVPTEVSIGLHMRDLAAVWLLAAAATAGVFALATCWLRRPAAKAAVFGRNTTEEWRAPAPAEAPRSSQEEWVRAAAARRPAARSKLQQKMPQVVRDDSDEGELDG